MDTSKYLETFIYVNLSNSDRRALEMPAELVEYIEHLNRHFKYIFPKARTPPFRSMKARVIYPYRRISHLKTLILSLARVIPISTHR